MADSERSFQTEEKEALMCLSGSLKLLNSSYKEGNTTLDFSK